MIKIRIQPRKDGKFYSQIVGGRIRQSFDSLEAAIKQETEFAIKQTTTLPAPEPFILEIWPSGHFTGLLNI